ncbi:hypothetical protein AOQ84DRAFT_186655 [Glonium stellatum]|uniref:Uncharacterized protein n=1 Tax=Glonium stellatum TaxID=574774 RepID=A0A8E2F6U3_9PEZI|nr:hypothetical protein AOQ84DRAFT_186655 [Glonium stellatum]
MSLFPPYPLSIHDTAASGSPFKSRLRKTAQLNQLYYRGITGQPHSSNFTASHFSATHGINHDEIIAICCIVLLIVIIFASMGWSLQKRRQREYPITSQNSDRSLGTERRWLGSLQMSDKRW